MAAIKKRLGYEGFILIYTYRNYTFILITTTMPIGIL